MAEASDQESKTEQPTEKKIRDALEQGKIPVSREASIFASMAALMVIQSFLIGQGVQQLVPTLKGFLDDPDVPRALELCRAHGLAIDPMTTSFFLGRETLVASIRPELGQVQERLFIALSTGAVSATHYFGLPADRVVELGTQIEI